MRVHRKYLLYYCTLFALFVTASGLVTTRTTEWLISQAIFLPVTAFLVISTISEFRGIKKLGRDSSGVLISHKNKKLIVVFLLFLVLVSIAIVNLKFNGVSDPYSSNNIVTEAELNEFEATSSSESSPSAQEQNKRVKIKIEDGSSEVNIREKATIFSPVIATALDGDEYVLLTEDVEFYEIELEGGKSGWIYKNYVVESEVEE
jgi:hypothetical protein